MMNVHLQTNLRDSGAVLQLWCHPGRPPSSFDIEEAIRELKLALRQVRRREAREGEATETLWGSVPVG